MKIGLGIGIPFIRNYVSSIVFDPSKLFTGSTNGVWYDPSDTTTLYRDAAGTQPVTAVEQPVGLMLDKSKGLVLGPELVTNGDFSNGTTGWTLSANASVTGNALVVTSAPQFEYFATSTPGFGTVGNYYSFTFTISNYSGGQVGLYFYNDTGHRFSSNGTYTVVMRKNDAGGIRLRSMSTTAFSATIDNISVRELPGNHAFNSSGNSANFPVLSARYNLLTKTDSLGPANGWVTYPGSWTGTYATAPDGTNTAMSIKNVATSLNQYYYSYTALSATYRMSVWAKQNTGTSIDLFEYYTNNTNRVRFSLIDAGSITLNNNGYNAGIYQHLTAPGWYYCFVDIPVIAGNREFDFVPSVANTEVYMWGADLRVANDALNQPAYQRVNTTTDYDTVGFKPYLRFNGAQWLQTNSIDFSATDKMFVSAGVRKLTTPTTIVAEFSSNVDTNNGSFHLANNSGQWQFVSKGTALSAAIGSGNTTPSTKVISGFGDTNGNPNDQAILRVNGTQAAISTADQGTGNFGNYPLYIGARAGSSLWFNGRLYGLIVAGKLANAVEITETEKYVNGKTAAY